MHVAVDCIDIVSGARQVKPEDIDFLALNIKEVGLINPVILVSNDLVPGRYTMVAGRNRLAAIKALGWDQIEASIRSYSEANREMAELGENLARTNYNPAERQVAMKRWHDLYTAAHPEVHAVINGEVKTNLVRGRTKNPTSVPKPKRTKGAVAATAKAFKTSRDTVERAIARAEAFTDSEHAVLSDRQLATNQIAELARTEPAERVQVITLLAAGMDYSEAMKEVLADKYEDNGDGDPVSDEEFLETCQARNKSNKSRFDADALLYRQLQKQRIKFARQIGWTGLKAKVGEMGIYARRVMALLDCKHPRDWLHCSNCVRGQTQFGECKSCRGGGYLIG